MESRVQTRQDKPSIEWMAPKGTMATAYEFAIPKRYATPVTTEYGYDAQNLMYSSLSLPKDLPEGKMVLAAKASWQVCKDLCIQNSAELSLALDVTSGVDANSPYFDLFEAYRQRHPSRLEDLPLSVETALSSDSVMYEKAFEYIVKISPLNGQSLSFKKEQPDGWPFYAPILEPRGMMFLNCAENCDDSGTGPTASVEKIGSDIVLRLRAEAFDHEPPKPLVLGGLFQLSIDGKQTAFEIIETLTVASSGSESNTKPIPVPLSDASFSPVAQQLRTSSPVSTEANLSADSLLSDAGEGVKADESIANAVTESNPESQSFVWMLFLAFVGGLILNIMPCVLPVLSLKLYSLIGQQDISDAERKMSGLMYTAGILVSFLALGAIVVALKGLLVGDFRCNLLCLLHF